MFHDLDFPSFDETLAQTEAASVNSLVVVGPRDYTLPITAEFQRIALLSSPGVDSMPRFLALFALLTMAGLVPDARAQTVPTGFNIDTLVSSGLNAPNDFCILPDGRILICERQGDVKLFRPGITGVTTVGTVPNVTVGSERGLLSIAVRNDELFCWASRTGGNMRLSRFTLVGSLNAPTSSALSFLSTSERVILANVPDAAFNHNGGTVRFGPDGMLYQTNGDDANCSEARNPQMYQGKVFRLDVSGVAAGGGPSPTLLSITPADNPFASSNNAVTRLLIAMGLRNPFSMCIDPVTGDLFIGDVGQSNREELDWYQRDLTQPPTAVNFGWPWREGFIAYGSCSGIGTQPSGLLDPIDDRLYSSGGRSIMCAGVVRNFGGPYDFGPDYEGNVFHNDYYNGTIERLEYDAMTGTWSNAAFVPGQATTTYWGSGFMAATHFDQGPDGAIYFVQHSGTGATSGGSLKRIRGGGPIYAINFSDGDGQVATSGTTFGKALEVEVTDVVGGAAVAGVEVTLTAEDSASLGSAGPFITDAFGKISVPISSTGLGDGNVRVQASLLGAAPATANLFGRKLQMVYVQGTPDDTVFVDVFNTSNDPTPSLPLLFGLTYDLQPIYSTIFGDLYLDLVSGVNTFVIEDGGGSFGGANYGPVAPFATPNWSTSYTGAPSFLSGQTWRFQAIIYDATVTVSQMGAGATNVGFTNPVWITYP